MTCAIGQISQSFRRALPWQGAQAVAITAIPWHTVVLPTSAFAALETPPCLQSHCCQFILVCFLFPFLLSRPRCCILHISFFSFSSLDDTCKRVDGQQQRLGHVFHNSHILCFVQAEFHCP